MKPNAKKRSANKSGAVLVTAVVVLLIMSILMTATIGHVAVNRRKTNSNYSRKQAYLTASTTLKSFVAEIRDITSAPTDASDAAAVAKQIANINALKQLAQADGGKGTKKQVTYNGNDGTDYKLGTTELEIKTENGNADKLVITAYTTYGGETEKVAAHISTETAKKPAKFTNTLEEIGKSIMSLDNLSIVGDTAVLDNTNLSKTYTLNNNCNLLGSLYVWGNVKTTSTGSSFLLRPNMQQSSMGSFVMISQDFTGKLKASTSMERNDGFNYVYVGGTLKSTYVDVGYSGKVEGHQIDIITHGFDTTIDQGLCGGENFNVYGNVYCYSEDPPVEGQKGDFLIGNNTQANIDGDCFIEGDLDLTKCNKSIGLNVTGDVHVKGTIKGNKSKIKAKNIYEGTKAVIDKTGRGTDPKEKMEYSAEAYEFMPEDMFMNIDGASSDTFKTQYLNFYKGTPLNMFKDFNTNIDTSEAAFNFYVDKDCVIDNLANNSAHPNNNTVLVDVKDKDVMIMLKAGTSIQDGSGPEIVVRNLSPIEKHTDQDTGRETEQHKFNCYFVSDSGDKIVANGKDAKGVHLHTGSNAHLSNPDNAYFEFGNMWVYDYETYIRMFSESFRKNKDRSPKNAGSSILSNFYYNPTANKDLNGNKGGKIIYGPGISNIIFLVGENFSFGATPRKAGTGLNGEFYDHGVANNAGFMQISYYGPQTTFGMCASGMSVKCVDADGNPYNDINGKTVQGAGVFIAGMFNSKNTVFYLYTEPASTSVLSNAKGNKGGEIAGFNLDRYDHY